MQWEQSASQISGCSAQIIVVLNGNGPWQYRYGNDLTATNRNAYISPDTLLIANSEPSAYFKLFSVNNSCGTGTLIEPSTVRVEIITAVEELFLPFTNIIISPNPVINSINVRFDSAVKREFTLYSNAGIPVWANRSSEKEPTLNFTQFVPGI